MFYQDTVGSVDNGDRIDAIVIDISKAFDLVLHDRLLMKIAISGVDWVRMGKGVPFGLHAESQNRRAIIRGR